eukprot:Sdes_comp19144_c0_seq1m9881
MIASKNKSSGMKTSTISKFHQFPLFLCFSLSFFTKSAHSASNFPPPNQAQNSPIDENITDESKDASLKPFSGVGLFDPEYLNAQRWAQFHRSQSGAFVPSAAEGGGGGGGLTAFDSFSFPQNSQNFHPHHHLSSPSLPQPSASAGSGANQAAETRAQRKIISYIYVSIEKELHQIRDVKDIIRKQHHIFPGNLLRESAVDSRGRFLFKISSKLVLAKIKNYKSISESLEKPKYIYVEYHFFFDPNSLQGKHVHFEAVYTRDYFYPNYYFANIHPKSLQKLLKDVDIHNYEIHETVIVSAICLVDGSDETLLNA